MAGTRPAFLPKADLEEPAGCGAASVRCRSPTGTAIGLVFRMAASLDIRWEEIFTRPEMLNRYAWLGGACQAVCAYLFGILPLEHLRPRLRQYPKSVTYAAAFAGALLGASSGCMLAFSRVRLVLGGGRVLRQIPARCASNPD